MRLNYNALFTHAVAAIQELASTVAKLEARLAALEVPVKSEPVKRPKSSRAK